MFYFTVSDLFLLIFSFSRAAGGLEGADCGNNLFHPRPLPWLRGAVGGDVSPGWLPGSAPWGTNPHQYVTDPKTANQSNPKGLFLQPPCWVGLCSKSKEFLNWNAHRKWWWLDFRIGWSKIEWLTKNKEHWNLKDSINFNYLALNYLAETMFQCKSATHLLVAFGW